MTYKPYTGIGSRETPTAILDLMIAIGGVLAQRGFTLRSGGADGADDAFEQGCTLKGGPKEIYLPWAGFNGRTKSPCYPGPDAYDLAAKFHPAWQNCSQAAMKLHARNCYQVLGKKLDSPTRFVICWTQHAKRGGGTGQALRLAEHLKIPIFDLADANQRQEIITQLSL